MKGRLQAETGLSLLEVIVSMSLFSMFLFALLTFYSLGFRSYQQGATQADVQQNARIALYNMDRSLRVVDRFTIQGGSVIEFYFPNNNRKYTYRVRYGELEYLIGTSVTKVASHITSVEFSCTPEGVIHFTVTAEAHGRKYALSSAVKPRNIP